MHQLLLLRHAKSASDDAKLPDHARPVNARGRQAAAAMRKAIGALGFQPDIVLVSSARRTLQTLELLEPLAGSPRIEPMDALYLASAGQIVRVLATVTESVRSVLLIGHNPGLHEFALQLAGTGAASDPGLRRISEGFPTCALAEFLLQGPWHGLAADTARLTRFLVPTDLPELAV